MPVVNPLDVRDKSLKIYRAAKKFSSWLEQGKKVTTKDLKDTFYKIFNCHDNEGVWLWKDAYEALEIAQILYLMRAKNQDAASQLSNYARILQSIPTHTKRTRKQTDLQQFSTPITIAYLAYLAAKIAREDVVLEPSAGNGMLAAFAQRTTSDIFLNEIDSQRVATLKLLFPHRRIFQHNAEQIDDRLDRSIRPTVILANPPFTASLNLGSKSSRAIEKHLVSALQRLEPGGRLVLISQESLSPQSNLWYPKLVRIQQELATLKFSAGIPGKAYYKNGSSMNTRITVFDKEPSVRPSEFPQIHPITELPSLLKLIEGEVPSRSSSNL